jgi:hypothetical protein
MQSTPKLTSHPQTSPAEQDAADRAEDTGIAAVRSWRDEWNGGFLCALQLAVAINRRDFDNAKDNLYHLQCLFAEPARP